MALYLDTEFNGYKGELISVGIWNPVTKRHFYEERNINWIYKDLTEFVTKYVRPKLSDIPNEFLQNDLVTYLTKHEGETIYADWPEDFIHLLYMCCGNMGIKYISQLKMELITTPDNYISKKPHHALWDAEALYINHKYPNWKEGDPTE
jgi:hypothetical protein